MPIDLGSTFTKEPSLTAIRFNSVWLAVPARTWELTMTRMTACMMHCGSASMSTSPMMRVAAYAGTNWRNDSGMGVIGRSPNGPRNMRKSRKNMPNGKLYKKLR